MGNSFNINYRCSSRQKSSLALDELRVLLRNVLYLKTASRPEIESSLILFNSGQFNKFVDSALFQLNVVINISQLCSRNR